MSDLTFGEDKFAGSIKTSCETAAQLVRDNIAIKVIWRPDGINHSDANNDVAYVWTKENYHVLQQSNNTESE